MATNALAKSALKGANENRSWYRSRRHWSGFIFSPVGRLLYLNMQFEIRIWQEQICFSQKSEVIVDERQRQAGRAGSSKYPVLLPIDPSINVSNMLDMYTDHAGAQLGAEMKIPNEGQGIHAYAQFYEKS